MLRGTCRGAVSEALRSRYLPALCPRSYSSLVNSRHVVTTGRKRRCVTVPVFTRSYTSLIDQYREEVAAGKLTEDPKQIVMLEKLEMLRTELDSYQPPASRSFISKLFSASEEIPGLYVHGGVGCGKTMIMDMFFDSIHSRAKLRTHFHDFMLDVHERLHKFKLTLPPSHISDRKCYDPIAPIARDIAADTFLLCFDEFQVTDVADAMMLKRLFQALWEEGIVMVATGNRPPDDLYKNGLQRSTFLPFIPLLKSNCNVLDMDSVVDYRLSDPKPLSLPGGRANFIRDDVRVDELFEHLTGVDVREAQPRALHFMGRELRVGRAHGDVLMTSYKELCEDHHGSSDFRALAKTYSHVLIKDFPQLSLKHKTPLRRFIIMMDIFYDRSVKIILSSHVPIDQIINLSGNQEINADELRMLMDDLALSMDEAKSMSLFTGEDEMFAHKRAISRLFEMQCADYWDLPHKPGKLS